jgi:hypothetical protein
MSRRAATALGNAAGFSGARWQAEMIARQTIESTGRVDIRARIKTVMTNEID